MARKPTSKKSFLHILLFIIPLAIGIPLSLYLWPRNSPDKPLLLKNTLVTDSTIIKFNILNRRIAVLENRLNKVEIQNKVLTQSFGELQKRKPTKKQSYE